MQFSTVMLFCIEAVLYYGGGVLKNTTAKNRKKRHLEIYSVLNYLTHLHNL